MKKSILFIVVLFIFVFIPLFVNAKSVSFGEIISKPYSENDVSIINKSVKIDDGYILIGSENLFGAFLIKTDESGNILWKKTTELFFAYHDVILGSDNTYIVAGACSDASHACLFKFDRNGEIVWKARYGSMSRGDYFKSVIKVDDGYIVAGTVYNENIPSDLAKGGSDGIVAKYDESGNLVWQKIYGGSGYDQFKQMIKTSDGGYLVHGITSSSDIPGLTFNDQTSKRILIKYDSDFNMIWQKEFSEGKSDTIEKIVEDNDGGFVVLASKDPNYSTSNAILYKLDKNANVVWANVTSGNGDDSFFDIVIENDCYVVLGATTSTNLVSGMEANEGGMYTGVIVFDRYGNSIYTTAVQNTGYDFFASISQIEPYFYFIFGVNVKMQDGNVKNMFLTSTTAEFVFEVYDLENIHGTYEVKQQRGELIVTPKPDDGYEVDRVFVYDGDDTEKYFPYTKVGQEYHFDIFSDVYVVASFKKINNNGQLFNNKWSVKNNQVLKSEDELFYNIYNAFSKYKNGVIAYEVTSYNNGLSGNIRVYDSTGVLVKEKATNGYFIFTFLEANEALYALAYSSSDVPYILKLDNDLNIIDTGQLLDSITLYDVVYGNIYGIEMFVYHQNQLYIVTEDAVFVYDTSLNLTSIITQTNGEICSIVPSYCLIYESSSFDGSYYGFDKLGDKSVVVGDVYGEENYAFIKLYENDTLLFEKKFYEYDSIFSVILLENHIVFLAEKYDLEIVILDYSGNVIQNLYDTNASFGLIKLDSGFVVKGINYAPENNGVCEYYEMCYLTSVNYYELSPTISVVGENSNKIEIVNNAKPGETVNVEVEGKFGYTFEGLKITDSNGRVTIVNGKSFVMPDTAVQVEPIYSPIINPDTGSFISIVFVILMGFVSFGIYRYGNKKKPILKI